MFLFIFCVFFFNLVILKKMVKNQLLEKYWIQRKIKNNTFVDLVIYYITFVHK
jgi:hypothetical protein